MRQLADDGLPLFIAGRPSRLLLPIADTQALLVPLAFVVTGATCFGLPGTAILQRLNRESCGAYVLLGVGAAIVLIAVACTIERQWDGFRLMAAIGTFSGAVTGYYWWAYARQPSVR